MFGSSSPFGHSSSSPFQSQSIFVQTNNAASNPFAPKPFGSGPFGSPTGGSMFGGTSTGVFGSAPSSSPLSSTPAFGASSTPFGNSIPAFGASSTPAFGGNSTNLGGSSIFGQITSGGFGSPSTQSSPFGSAFQQTQPAFASTLFGSTPAFGAASTPLFGATSSPAFGASSTPAFGTTSTAAFGFSIPPAFGSTATAAFGSTGTGFGVSSTPAFGSVASAAFGASNTPLFGSSNTPSFGSSSTPFFGSSSTLSFGSSSTPLFGSSSIPSFGSSSTPTFGSSSTPAFGSSSLFGASSSPSFNFGSTPAFGQSSSAFSNIPIGSTSPFGVQNSPFGSQTTTQIFGSPGFGQSNFSSQQGGSRIAAYTPTIEFDGGSSTQPTGKLESISAMPVYKDKSHEELRWDDYQHGDKGGPNRANQAAAGIFSAPTQSNLFSPMGTFGHTAANPFSASSNLFTPKTPTFGTSGFGGSSLPGFNSPFGTSFGTPSTSGFGVNSSPSLFGGSSIPAFSSSAPSFSSASAPGTGPFGSSFSTQSSGLFQSATPPLGQTTSGFGSTPLFGSSNLFNTPTTGFSGNLFTGNSAPSLFGTSNPIVFGLTLPSLSSAFQPAAPAQTPGLFSNFTVPMAAASSGFGGSSNIFGIANFGQPAANPNIVRIQLVPVTNPFGTLPAMPQLSIGRGGSSPSVQYGIASIPVNVKPTPLRVSSLFKPRHLSQRRIRVSKHHSKDGLNVPFFSDTDRARSMPNTDALFVPRENPRALIILPMDQWPRRCSLEKQSPLKDMDKSVQPIGETSGEASAPPQSDSSQDQEENQSKSAHDGKENAASSKSLSKAHETQEDHTYNVDSSVTISDHKADEAAMDECGTDIVALMPKLHHSDYYTEPQILELSTKERAEPGYCSRVKNFMVGRHGYGSIKFFGETDIRRLDLESLVQFNNREVIVYMDDNKKPPIGQGLNKPAQVTLLNIKCINKKTGEQYTDGPKVERYKEMLVKKTQEQGAKFISFDPIKGEWKFKVDHFSRYELTNNA